jgi:ArsR family transcriptional regulator
VSYHLKQLVEASLIGRERRGNYAHYGIVPGALDEVAALVGTR